MNSFMLPMRDLLLCATRDDDVAQGSRGERQASYGFAQFCIAGYKTDFHHTVNALGLNLDQACDAQMYLKAAVNRMMGHKKVTV
jgi:hypothetical protein